MLKPNRRVFTLLVATAAVFAAVVLGAAPASQAACTPPPVTGKCPPGVLDCQGEGGTCPDPRPSQPNNTGGGCAWRGQTVPCWIEGIGWYSSDGCYYDRDEEQRLPSLQPPPEGMTVYWKYCIAEVGPDGQPLVTDRGLVALPNPPAANPEAAARRALATITLPLPQLGIAPDPGPGSAGLVGLPVWMWTQNTVGPIAAFDQTGPLRVDIKATVSEIRWNMGDGNSVTCAGAGTPYQASYGGSSSPTCGYTYTTPSRNEPGGRYTVTATATWRVDWSGGGFSGTITTTRVSQPVTLRIEELQVVVR